MTEVHDAPPAGAGAPQPPDARPPLRRSRRDKVLAGVCGGLGRYFDLDPVVFRIVLGVLTVTGGVGLIFYGFAWLMLPQEGEARGHTGVLTEAMRRIRADLAGRPAGTRSARMSPSWRSAPMTVWPCRAACGGGRDVPDG
ncbi:PspC domain-containing protein, partial [Streptomyces sp. NPDC059233]